MLQSTLPLQAAAAGPSAQDGSSHAAQYHASSNISPAAADGCSLPLDRVLSLPMSSINAAASSAALPVAHSVSSALPVSPGLSAHLLQSMQAALHQEASKASITAQQLAAIQSVAQLYPLAAKAWQSAPAETAGHESCWQNMTDPGAVSPSQVKTGLTALAQKVAQQKIAGQVLQPPANALHNLSCSPGQLESCSNMAAAQKMDRADAVSEVASSHLMGKAQAQQLNHHVHH